MLAPIAHDLHRGRGTVDGTMVRAHPGDRLARRKLGVARLTRIVIWRR